MFQKRGSQLAGPGVLLHSGEESQHKKSNNNKKPREIRWNTSTLRGLPDSCIPYGKIPEKTGKAEPSGKPVGNGAPRSKRTTTSRG